MSSAIFGWGFGDVKVHVLTLSGNAALLANNSRSLIIDIQSVIFNFLCQRDTVGADYALDCVVTRREI